MVGKTPQVREIIYNVLDDSGERTVVAKGATTVDVGDTKELFTRTTDLELVTSNTFSNVVNVQSNIISIESYLSQFSGSVYSPLLVTLQRDHADNAERIEVLEEVHLSNSIIVSNNFSNITVLQEIVDSNIERIDGVVADQSSNAIILDGTFSNVSNIQTQLLSNVGRIEDLETDIGAIVNYGDITSLQSIVTDLNDRVTQPIVRIGNNAGSGTAGATSVSIGDSAGRNIGDNSIGIGARAQFLATPQDALSQTTVINATGLPLAPTRRDTLVIAPIQTDDSNTINIMGYNDLTKEVVQSTLLRGIDGNVHATTNISVNNDTILLETNGNGSFGGDIDITGNLEVGGTSSFTGAMQVDDTLEIADTSSFGGNMTIDANAFVYGQSFAMYDDDLDENIYIRNDGNASFAEAITAKNINCDQTLDVFNSFRMVNGSTENATINKIGQSSFAGKMQIDDALVVQGHSSFIGGIKVLSPSTSSFGGPVIVNNTSSFTGVANFENNISMTGQSFMMYDGSDENIYIRNDGNASFAEAITAKNINCDQTLDVFNSFRMVDGSTAKATINKLGQSSFAGTMQINNTLDVDNTLTIKNGTTTDGKVTINPGTTSETLSVQGGIMIKNVAATNASISRLGTGSFTTLNGATCTLGGTTFTGAVGLGNNNITSSGTGSFSTLEGTTATFSGDVTGNDFVIPSDRRFKTEITHIPNALEKVKQISGCTYMINDKPSVGVIAQEVLKILPETVHTRDDGYYAVSYHGLIGLLIEAVKELSEKVK